MTTRHLLTVLTRKALSKKGKRKISWKSLESCPSSRAVKKKAIYASPYLKAVFLLLPFFLGRRLRPRSRVQPPPPLVPFPTIVARGKEEGRPMKISNLEKDPPSLFKPPPSFVDNPVAVASRDDDRGRKMLCQSFPLCFLPPFQPRPRRDAATKTLLESPAFSPVPKEGTKGLLVSENF